MQFSWHLTNTSKLKRKGEIKKTRIAPNCVACTWHLEDTFHCGAYCYIIYCFLSCGRVDEQAQTMNNRKKQRIEECKHLSTLKVLLYLAKVSHRTALCFVLDCFS